MAHTGTGLSHWTLKSMDKRILHFMQLAAIGIVVVSCYEVLKAFIPAILFAVLVCMSTWPVYLHLRRVLHEKSSLAALLMTLLLVLLVIGPMALLAASAVHNLTIMVDVANAFLALGPIEPPAWLKQIPIIGKQLNSYWRGLASGGKEAVALLEPAQIFLLSTVTEIGQGLLQMMFAAFIGFYFYRDGEALLLTLRNGLKKLAGDLGEEVLTTIHHTVVGVVRGIFGAALAQAMLAVIGFLIAGVPGAFLLGAATFFLSIIPIGPPLLWGGASVWLFNQGSYGWAVFMVLWGVFAISSIDNFIRPYLISRGSSLSLLLTTLGVFGGITAFGFIGIFIGPPILAVSLTLVKLWTTIPLEKTDIPVPAASS